MAYGSFAVASSNKYVSCTLNWSSTPNTSDNSSLVYFELRASRTNSGYTTYGTGSGYVTIDGTKVSFNITSSQKITQNSNTLLGAGSKTVYHNNDGSKSVSIEAYASIPGASLTLGPTSTTVNLDNIPRQATITSAPNFTDEENPTITYSNPAGNAVTSLRACISWTGGADIAYRPIDVYGTSYTFNLTPEEKAALQRATLPNNNGGRVGNSRTVKFYVTTVIGGNTYYSTLDRTFTVINANPTLSPSIIDTGLNSTRLTGEDPTLPATKIIKGHNYLVLDTGASAVKEADITAQSITCGNTTIRAFPGTMSNAESGTFAITATDSRGNTTTQTVQLEVIDYKKLTCGLNIDNPTVDGDLTFDIVGNYFDGDFGAMYNSLDVQYRIKIDGKEWAEEDGWFNVGMNVSADIVEGFIEGADITIESSQPAIADGTYRASVKITGLDYRTTYKIQARAKDEVYTGYIRTTEYSVKTTPVYDWSNDDFDFHVPVFRDGNPMGYYPIGGIYTSSDNTDPGELFGGAWALERRFYGGELLAYGTAWNSTSGTKVFLANSTYGISDVLGGIYTDDIHNYMPDILTGSSGTIWAQTKGVVGMIEATVTLSGFNGGSGAYGVWFLQGNKNQLPSSVTIAGGGTLLTSNSYYGGNSATYFYSVSDDDSGTDFFINPRWQPYGGGFTPCDSGTISTLQVKAYAKGKVTYMWKRVA